MPGRWQSRVPVALPSAPLPAPRHRTQQPNAPTFPAREVRFETPPGRQAQVDFAHFRTVFTDEPGVERIIWLFSLVLGHSRMLWGRFVLHQDRPTLLRCQAAAFEALGGVPEQVLYEIRSATQIVVVMRTRGGRTVPQVSSFEEAVVPSIRTSHRQGHRRSCRR